MGYYTIAELESKTLAEGVQIRVIPGARMTMVVFSLQNGASIPEHSHPHEQMGMVVKGRVKMVIDGIEQLVQPGSAWHIPAEVVHSGACLEDDTLVVEVFSPPREDLVNK